MHEVSSFHILVPFVLRVTTELTISFHAYTYTRLIQTVIVSSQLSPTNSPSSRSSRTPSQTLPLHVEQPVIIFTHTRTSSFPFSLRSKGKTVMVSLHSSSPHGTHLESLKRKTGATEATGLMSSSQFERYCQMVRDTSTWGGEPEILALCRAYGVCINVVQSGRPAIVPHEPAQGMSEKEGVKVAYISYHRRMYGLGEVRLPFGILARPRTDNGFGIVAL